ncbi:hypothetical protein PpBr36_08603 [Pyricularia pennisetigena]|uniref:hypothetical protein n=1 Tax=Pyricularia pennisetigena TaxID=1578925 RepID=UPI00114D8B34|nr:hypothetical protein PpBr36_08603 [Pyricularia pennisetigena]TLS24871.1 hypothetical protein PpBr36_08603 [Pyricularia pennisetigena]
MATESELPEMWASALAEYERDTKRPLDRKLLERMRKVTTPEDLLAEIEASDQAFGDFRNKRGGLWRKLSGFVPPLVAALKLVVVPLGASADVVGFPASAVFGALLHLVQSCQNVSDAFDWVEEVFGELKRFLDRLTALMQAPLHSLLKDQVIAILVCVLRVIGRSEALIRGSHFRQYLRVTFLGKDEKTTKIIGDFNKRVANEHLFEVSLTLATVQKIEDKQEKNTSDIRSEIQAVHNTIKEGQQQETAEQVQERIQRILCGTTAVYEVQETYHRIKKDLLQGTGAWIRDEPIFQSWIKHQASILWIFGGPGSGKSYLSAWITMQLTENLIDPEYTQESSVAYFFVKENNKDLRNANNILKTLAWQLCEQDVYFKAHVAAACKGNKNPTFTPQDTWENLFLGYYNSKEPVPTRATIVIDGLDEAPRETRQILLGFLKRLVSASRSTDRVSIQFAVVGRNDLRNDMDFTRQEKFYLIKVDKTKNQNDIDSYVRQRLEDVEVLRRMRRVKPRGKQDANAAGARIKKRILAGADGVFLWARLLIKMILSKDLAQIEEILREPPETLDDMIESVLDRMASDKDLGHQMLRKMLLYVVYVQRPLRFGELNEFLSLPDRKPNLLLWERTRGVLSAVFDLRFPGDQDPDEMEDDAEVNELDGSGDEKRNGDGSDQSDDEDDGFDFTGDDEDEDAGADDSEKQEIFVPIALHRLHTSWEVQLRRQNTTTQYHTYLRDAQLKTKITFCHARFKDYLQREGRSRNRTKLVHAIIPETERVHVEITMMCLEVFMLEYSLKDHSKYLVDYPLNYLGFHLRRVDLGQVSDFEFAKVVKGLYWLFGTERGAVCFVLANQDYDLDGTRSSESAFSRNWVTSVENLKLVQTWFRHVALRSTNVDVDHDVRAWMQTASESYAELLKCVMMAASKSWLTKPSYDSDEYRVKGYFPCWLMEGWLSLYETGEVSTRLEGLDYSYDSLKFLQRVSASHLKHLAFWAGLERDTHWHTCLGWMLMEGCHFTEAIAHYDMAIQLSPKDAWVAMEGRARCHGSMEEYQEAIDWQRRAIGSLPEGMDNIGAFLYPRIAEWAARLGDQDASFEAAELGFNIDEYSLLAQVRYIEALWRKDDLDRLMQIFDWLHRQSTDDERGYSWFVRLLLQGDCILGELGQACRKTGQPTWVLDELGAVEEQVQKGGSKYDASNLVWWSYNLMWFYKHWYDDCADHVMRLGEQFLDSLKLLSPELQRSWESQRSRVVNKLAELYYDKAVATWDEGRGATKATTFANKLKMLAVSVPTSTAEGFEGFDFFHKDYPALLWGRWLRDFRKADENAWKESFKVRLLEEMKSLDDEDPANDTRGMAALAVSLFHAGDRKNAAALLAILFQPLESYEPEEEEEDEESDEEQSVCDDDDDDDDDDDGDGKTKEDDISQGEAEYSGIADTDVSWEEVEGEEKEDKRPVKIIIQEPVNDEGKEEEGGQEQQPETLAESSGETTTTMTKTTTTTTITLAPPAPGPGLLIRRKTMPDDMLALNVEQGSWEYECCNCTRDPSQVDEFYFCEVCHQTHWCGECLAMMRDRTQRPGLAVNACNPVHDMYRAWPIDAEARDLAAVYMDGGATLRRKWLEELRASWLNSDS